MHQGAATIQLVIIEKQLPTYIKTNLDFL